MSKNKNRNKNRPADGKPSNGQNKQPAVSTSDAMIKDAEILSQQASEVAGDEKSPEVELPATAGQDDMRLALQMARQAKNDYDAAFANLKKKNEQVDKEKAQFDKVTANKVEEAERLINEAKVEKENMVNERDRLVTWDAELNRKNDEFVLRNEELVRREENAKNGFLKERIASLESLQKEAAEMRAVIAETTTYTTQRRVECEKECAERVAALNQREELQKTRERQLDQRERQAGWWEKDVEELAKAQVAHKIERAELERQAVEDRLQAARSEAEQRAIRVQVLEDAMAKLGGRSVEDVVAANKKLSRELAVTRTELEARPAADTSRYAAQLEAKCDDLTAQLHDLRQELTESQVKSRSAVIAVTELESLRDEKLSLEKRCELLRNANDSLRAEYDQIMSKAGQKAPFESCSQKDASEDMQSAPRSLREEIVDMRSFCNELQHRMAHDPKTGKELFYSIEDIRCFVAGLCMSKLHVLQGISGTGKTSMPIAFARAIGTAHCLVPVQAGWRDREDLLGHYNSFQNKYYESGFLQALYDAQCPKFSDRPFFIVLDEMNLSHPEQFFADFISLIEQSPDEQLVTLTTFPVPNPPRLFVDGSKIRIPPNVWFIGTANHDETTMDFADKTYDRAHVMELPRHRKEFVVDKRRPLQDPLSLDALTGAEAKACKDYGAKAVDVMKYLEERLLGLLGDSFDIGWGNRQERQLGSYVPMVLACGGSIGEATDHILATKLLRKLRGRHDNTEEALKKVQEVLDGCWIEKNHVARKSKAMIEEALRHVV